MLNFEHFSGIPDEMPDTVNRVIDEGKGPAKEQELAYETTEKITHGVECFGRMHSAQDPSNQHNTADRQGNARNSVQSLKRHRQVELVNL